ncbi:MAG TPA: Xaa-Pro peptidase family protein [Terriglobales bacterium]|nr:Xaa-Pro peptidase family protein [Terriglobales bacterium]
MDYKGRLKRLQRALSENRLDALLVTHLPNIRYLAGFTGSAGVLLLTENRALFFSDGRYTTQAKREVEGAKVVIAKKAPLFAAAEWLSNHRKGLGSAIRLGIEGDHLTVAAHDQLRRFLPAAFRLKTAPPLIEEARMRKDADEIASIKAAVEMGSRLFETVVAAIRPGTSEVNVAAELEHAARRSGAEQMSFETIIASGERSALPHGRASRCAIPGEGFVVCDFGVILSGYCSDMTRTVYVGRPPEEARRIYQAVKEAQQAAVDAVRPGVSTGEIDRVARKLLQKQGFGRYFTHSTGHGVGLEIHEAPRVAAGQQLNLQPGMVITIEPGAYIPGRWGVRIEDIVVVRENGCEVLTPTSKELIAVGG